MYTCAKFAYSICFSTWDSKYPFWKLMFLKSLIIICYSFLTLIIVLNLIFDDPLSSFSWYKVSTGNYCGFYSARYIMNSLCFIMSVFTNGSRLRNVSDNSGDSKYFTRLKSMSIKSQIGRNPVPPQIIKTKPVSGTWSYFNPAPIGSEITTSP